MSHKTVICFAIWTSFWSALFNHFYTVYFGSFGVPWIMFVCMAIYFGMGGTPKQVPGMILSAFCGLAWGQFDFILINFFGGTCHMSAEMASFMAILVGTAITMYIHIKLLGATPLGFHPFSLQTHVLRREMFAARKDGYFLLFFENLTYIVDTNQITYSL